MRSLLATKFFIPPAAAGWVPRPRLLARLDQALVRPLTLVSAPPGFGKTTLLSAWVAQLRAAKSDRAPVVGWLSLDAGDNDPARFWLYLAAALRPLFQAAAAVAGLEALMGRLESEMPLSYTGFLDALINEAAVAGLDGLVVLDDYHVLAKTEIHEAMTYLLEHLPPGLHLLVATRADPPFPLARMRARGQLVEVRAGDLRFTGAEVGAYIEAVTGLRLRGEILTALEASTEGWAAGLQMAALALNGQGPGLSEAQVQAFVGNFSGKHHFILDYLAEEVLNRQPEAEQQFLLETSVLERFNADLCAEILRDVSENGGLAGRQFYAARLAQLERANLFLVPLDEERIWFRYHHLFVDLLRVRLQQSAPERVAVLHQRAASWFEAQGLINEAVQHALAGQDWEHAARLLELHIDDFLERGQLSTVMAWIQALPKAAAERRPRLSARLAWALGLANQLKEAGEMVQAALRGLELAAAAGAEADSNEAIHVRAQVMLLQAYIRIASGQPGPALEIVDAVCQSLPGEMTWAWSWAYWIRGYALRALNDLPGAADALREAVRLAQESAAQPGRGASAWNQMVFLDDLGISEELWGKQRRAEALFREALQLGEQRGHGYLSRVEANLSHVLLQQNRLDEALEHAQAALSWSAWWPSSNHRVLALARLGQVHLGRGELAAAAEAILQADSERRQSLVLPVNDSLVDNLLVRLWLAQNDLERAGHWADLRSASASSAQPVDGASEIWMLALAQVRMRQGQYAQALDWLRRVEQAARQAGRVRTLVQVLAMLAAVHYSHAGQKVSDLAVTCLSESLQLAGSENYARIYLDAGEAIPAILRQALLDDGKGDHAGFADESGAEITAAARRLLTYFRDRDTVEAAAGASAQPGDGQANSRLVEPLTEREMDVLRLLAQGLSNRKMASQLYLSEGTIKTHVHNIIAKLDVQSRTHAVARAHELGLV